MATRALHKLSAIGVAKLNRPGRHSDGGGLYLAIDGYGRRRWVFMYRRYGRRTELGLGGARDVPLAKAREAATEFRALLATGGDPKAERMRKRPPTFGECADAYIKSMEPFWRNAKHTYQWKMSLTKYAGPLRPYPVNDVATQQVLDVLKPLWKRIPETAGRVRGRIENVLDAAKARGFRNGDNPARWRGHLDQLLPKRQRLARGHYTALPYGDLPAFMACVREREATAARALEFTILTAARTGEVLGATWKEFDLDENLWTVPAERMKSGREHRVPLSPPAMAILKTMQEMGTDGYVFPGPKPNSKLSQMAMKMLVRRMKVDVTVHGFRSTFRDWAAETTGFPHEVCEMALAHVITNKVEAAYRRGDLFDKRRTLMQAWAGYCGIPEGSTVVPIQEMRS